MRDTEREYPGRRMENALPTYEMATSQDHWSIIAPYIPSPDLCSAALVCERWHEIFAPHLWGNPASHFGTEDDSVYVALTLFRRTLAWARLYVRQMTHTLHMPPAHAELYEGPHSDWLRDILERLPKLQSLIVNGLPFFDHSSLLTLRYFSSSRRPTNPREFPTFTLRLLDARMCSNATSGGLAEALAHFPSLLYLDLSRTLAAKASSVLAAAGSLRNLQILKLTDLGLRDEDVILLAGKLGTRIRSLDVRNNGLTDKSARTLLAKCFLMTQDDEAADTSSFRESGSWSARTVRSTSPAPFQDEALLHHQDENLDRSIRTSLTTNLVDRLVLEDSSPSGITHLYISNNRFSAEAISGFLRSGRLHVLDCGDVVRTLPEDFPTPTSPESLAEIKLPGVVKVLPVIAGLGSRQMTYLRINHEIVTEELVIPPTAAAPRTELPGDTHVPGIEPPLLRPELDAGRIPAELADTGTTRFELPGDSIFMHVTPAEEHHSASEEQSMTFSSVGSSNAVQSWYEGDDGEPSFVLNASGSGLTPEAAAMNGTTSPPSTMPVPSMRPFTRPFRSYSSVVAERSARAAYNKTHPHTLSPSMICKMQTLVLTEVPARASAYEPIKHLIEFITACGEEASLAHQQAELGYAMPPGSRGRISAQLEYARSIFALECIILELALPEAAATGRKPTTSWRRYPTKSSTEDADSEAFWDAAQYDFSFFGDEECGLPQQQLGPRGALFSAVSDKIVVGQDDAWPPPFSQSQQQRQQRAPVPAPASVPQYDVVAELANFRRERKARYEAALAMGDPTPRIPGYWEGEVKIVRPPAAAAPE